MEKIAEKCCGSCENCEQRMNGIVSFHFCEKVNASVEPVTEYYCKDYYPRNPIENKYQKMWEELKTNIKDFQIAVKPLPKLKDDLSSKLLLKSMEELQEKHK